ncbi:TSUP family transporter [Gottfriedia luciferensis]|uniref:TSUP family transporter n=1 Tax=Gottfriedia luciferensis TaxID=178774 RepID=UPI000B4445E3|nr:TSUP family transporter [Gottfriedia luciferensis]
MEFHMDLSTLFILIAFGFFASFIDSVVGGGGLISLPALLFSGLNPATAVATNKLASTMGSLTSNIMFYRSGNINIKTGIKLFPLSVIGSILGAWTVHWINPNVLKPLMLVMLGGIAIYTILKKDWGSVSTPKKLSISHFIIFTLLIFAIGFYDGFLGPGTGSFLIFTFLLIGYDFLKAAGNAKFLNLGSNMGALLMFIYLGQVNFTFGIIMGLAQIAGGVIGSKFAIKKGTGYIRALFITVSFLLLAKNIYDYIH